MHNRRILVEGVYTIQEAVAMGFHVKLNDNVATRTVNGNDQEVIHIVSQYEMLRRLDRDRVR